MDSIAHKDKYTIAKQDRQKYIDAVVQVCSDKKLVVAGPGTGKTFLFKSVLHGKNNTLTLSFVNSLVEDLSLELFGLSDVKTLHSFARSQLEKVTRKSVRIFPKLTKVIEQDAKFLLSDDINFDYLFHNRVDTDSRLNFYTKRRKYYDYFCFCDLVYTAVLYFEQHEDKIPSYSQVVVDEFQDFNALEVSLIDLLAKKSKILLAGDDDQALYVSLKSASPRHIRQRHACEIGNYSCFSLPYCSRSSKVIVEAANDIIIHAQENGLLSGRINKPFEYFPDANKDMVSEANPRIIYSHIFAKQISWFIQKNITEITRLLREKFTVLILSPYKKQCHDIYEALKSKGFQNIHFTEKSDIVNEPPSLLDGLKLLLIDNNCNLGWRIVSKELLDDTNFCSLLRMTNGHGMVEKFSKIVSPSLKNQAEKMLSILRFVRDGKKIEDNPLSEFLSQIGIDAYKDATESLQDEIKSKKSQVDPGIRKTPIVVSTIQSSKGLQADFVFITNFDNQYFIKDIDKGITDQDVCSFIVALTRALRKVFLLSTNQNQTPTFLTWIDKSRICEIKSRCNNDI